MFVVDNKVINYLTIMIGEAMWKHKVILWTSVVHRATTGVNLGKNVADMPAVEVLGQTKMVCGDKPPSAPFWFLVL